MHDMATFSDMTYGTENAAVRDQEVVVTEGWTDELEVARVFSLSVCTFFSSEIQDTPIFLQSLTHIYWVWIPHISDRIPNGRVGHLTHLPRTCMAPFPAQSSLMRCNPLTRNR